jgi:hypothetical protein
MAGNGFVSGERRISRWRTVEECSHRLWCGSVMTVREKCDEKELRGWNPRLCVSAAGRATHHPQDLGKAESGRVGGSAGHPSASLGAGFLEKREKWRTRLGQ